MSKLENKQRKTPEQIIRAKSIWLIVSGFISVVLTYFFVAFLLFVLQLINPDYNNYYEHFWLFSYDHGEKFRFYSGEKSGPYAKIGKAITSDARKSSNIGDVDSIGVLDDKDTIENFASSGGYENFMKVTSEKNSFSLVQEAVLKLQDDLLLKSVKVITPLFEERLHILYRKALIPAKYKCDSNLQLSANTETCALNSFFQSVKKVEAGAVGSCTRIIAGDIMDLIENQIGDNSKGKSRPNFILKGDPLSDVFANMKGNSNHLSKKAPDLVFYLGLDPTNEIKDILDSGNYKLMSISPSFLALLNAKFKMNLQVANFQKKYDHQEATNTVGTFTFLIASRDISSDDIKNMLKKISWETPVIHKSLYKLPTGCNDSCYRGLTDSCPYILPLTEFGFYKYYRDEARESKSENSKATIPFVLALITFFFPILKSILALKSFFRIWMFNRKIDRILAKREQNPDFTNLKQEIADKYAEGQLTETHYKALDNRMTAHSGVDRQPKKDQHINQGNKKNVKNKTPQEFEKYATPHLIV